MLPDVVVVRGFYNRAWDNPDLEYPRIDAVIYGYEPGDPLEETWREVVVVDDVISCDGDHDEEFCYAAICDYFYMKHNVDDREDGAYERSLSIGDVIEIASSEGDIRRYGCVAMGWKRLAMEPTEA